MTISSTIARNDYVGNGATVTWTYGFKIFDKTQIAVTVYNTLTSVETPLILDLDYTVAGVGSDTGGSITQIIGVSVPEILPTTSNITIKRNLPLTQPTALKNQGQFFPATIEDALDREVMILQQQQDIESSAVRIPTTEVPTGLNTTLPTLASRLSKYLGFDSLGNLVAIASAAATSLVSGFMTPILLSTTGNQVRKSIGAREIFYGVDSGVSPSHIITLAADIVPTGYVDGMMFAFKSAFNSSASATLNVNGLGAKQIFKKGLTGTTYLGLQLSEYLVGEYVVVTYNAILDKFIVSSSIFGQTNLISFGTSGASGGTTYTTGNTVKRIQVIETGHCFQFKVDVANTGACTLNVNATGPVPLKVSIFGVTQDPPAGFFSAGDIVTVVYDGTNYVAAQDSSVPKLVSTTSVTAVAVTPDIPLVSGKKYRIEYQLTQNTANGTLGLRFNADAGANYKWTSILHTSVPANASTGANAATSVPLQGAATATFPFPMNGVIEVTPDRADNTIATLVHRASFRTNAGNDLGTLNGGGFYDGAAAVTSFRLTASAGTMTGKILLYALPS